MIIREPASQPASQPAQSTEEVQLVQAALYSDVLPMVEATTQDTLDSLGQSISYPSAHAAAALGLPTGNTSSGVLIIFSDGTQGQALWFPRLASAARIYSSRRGTGGWSNWST